MKMQRMPKSLRERFRSLVRSNFFRACFWGAIAALNLMNGAEEMGFTFLVILYRLPVQSHWWAVGNFAMMGAAGAAAFIFAIRAASEKVAFSITEVS